MTPERVSETEAAVQAADGPPPGVDSTGFQLLFDEAQGTALFIGYFETEEKMREAGPVFERMDPSDTPGTRASVDLCEVRAEGTA